MPLKKSAGHMYPWVTHTHTHLGGECRHRCRYCYVDNPRFGRPDRYKGEIRIIEKELSVRYGKGRTIFVENCNDIGGPGVTDEMRTLIFRHCRQFPENDYVFQSKNPAVFAPALWMMPDNVILGTTIETNRIIEDISDAPLPADRVKAMESLSCPRKFVTIEPVLDFDVNTLASWIARMNPEFLNLGADSKDHDLPEPTVEKIHGLVAKLAEYGIELREKHNLGRLTER